MTPALDEVSTEYGLLAEAVSYPDDHSSVTYRLRANARWHDGKPVTPDDVIYSRSRRSRRTARSYARLLPARRQGGEDRRARGHLHLRRPGQPRTAADRRPAHRAAEALVGRHRQDRQEARHRRRPRWSRRSAPAPTGSRSSRPAARIVYETRRTTIGARTSTSTSAPTISTRSASSISATRPSRSKPSRPTRSTGAPRTAPRTGRPPTISRRCRTSA